jgi:hypothetical protein
MLILENHGLVTMGIDNRKPSTAPSSPKRSAKIMYIAISLECGEPKWPSDKDIKEYLDWIYYRKLP